MFLIRLFVPHYRETADPAVRSSCGLVSSIVGIVCNLFLAGAKFAVGMISGSIAVTADAVNNLADASGSVVTLIGFRMAGKPADKDHPYGHARAEYLSGFVVAMLILFMGFEIFKEAVGKLLNPVPVEMSLALGLVLGASVLVKLWLFSFNRKLGKHLDSAALHATAADCRNDAVSTAAILVAALVQEFAHIPLDGFVGLGVAALILWSGVGVARDTLSLLLGNGPDQELRGKLEKELFSHEKILGCHDLLVHDYGPGRRFATVHVEMDGKEDPLLCHEIIDTVERTCRERLGVELSIHYDPIVVGDPVVDQLRAVVTDCAVSLDPALSIHDFRMVPGSVYSTVLFDVALPFRMRGQKEALREALDKAVKQHNSNYCTIIEFDETDA